MFTDEDQPTEFGETQIPFSNGLYETLKLQLDSINT